MPETLTADHLKRLRAEHETYSSGALHIQTKQGTLVPFDWNEPQSIVARKVEEQKQELGKVRVLILKARQEGISTWCASRIYHGCTLWTHRRGLVVADKLERASEIFGIYERFDRELPEEIRPISKSKKRTRELSWTTDSRITVETAGDPDAGRGSTIGYLHASELAMWPHAEETWTGLMQAVPSSSGEVFVESTAKGVGNLFHRLWLQAEAGDSDWLPIFLPWWVHEEYQTAIDEQERTDIVTTSDPWERKASDEGVEWEGSQHKLIPEQLAWRRQKISNDFLGDERTFRQEYPATSREAFITTGDGFFDAIALEEYERRTKRPRKRGNFVWSKTMNGFKFQRSDKGYVRIWEERDPEGHYVIGGDTAEGKRSANVVTAISEEDQERGGRDYSSADVIKVSEIITKDGKQIRTPCIRQVAQIHGRMAPEVFAEQVWAAGVHWSCRSKMHTRRRVALTAIERNHSSGQTVLSLLQNVWHHPELFLHRRVNVRGRSVTSYLGWITDGSTRMPMLDTLAAFIREGSIEMRCPETVREMFTFVRGDDGKPEAQEGTHDDRVMSLAIAVAMLEHHRDEPKGEIIEITMPEYIDH